MNMIIIFVVLVVVFIVLGIIGAITQKPEKHDSDSSPDIMISWKVPGPFDAFKDDK